jgi:hypothetical protein
MRGSARVATKGGGGAPLKGTYLDGVDEWSRRLMAWVSGLHCTSEECWPTISPSGRVDVVICGWGGTRSRGPCHSQFKYCLIFWLFSFFWASKFLYFCFSVFVLLISKLENFSTPVGETNMIRTILISITIRPPMPCQFANEKKYDENSFVHPSDLYNKTIMTLFFTILFNP